MNSPERKPPPVASSGPLAPCPTCRRVIAYSTANPWRPFCSERCKGVDLGAWANEQYRVADAPVHDDDGVPRPLATGQNAPPAPSGDAH